jgi:hypothetical protein
MESLKLIRVDGKLKPRHFLGNPYRIAYESGCDYYMTNYTDHQVKVHRINMGLADYESFSSIHVCCPKCISKMVPIHSSFNNDNTQVFKCVICEGIRGRG